MNKYLLLLFVIFIIFIIGCSGGVQYDGLANCLADKGVKEYGAFWCPNCAKQEKMFGRSYSILKSRDVYVECDPRCDVPENELPKACREEVGNPSLCISKGIDAYPTWEFPNGRVLVGVQDLEIIAKEAGCVVNG